MKKWMRFNLWVWCLVGLAVVWLLGLPPAMDFWAESHWNKVPCHPSPSTAAPDRYFYQVGDTQYESQRRDFWQSKGILHATRRDMVMDTPAFCRVSPSDPENSVLMLDAHFNFAHAGGSIAAAALLIAAAIILTRFGRPKKSPPAS
ncbi:MAG TPA: hypothetical protein VHM90_03275 [Phycisphaerae bacterium]|nr:hypothetical protein [Phycisphaerae bacterium]